MDGFDTVEAMGRATGMLAGQLDRGGAGSLVQLYYTWQEHRIALGNQTAALQEGGSPAAPVVGHFYAQVHTLEQQMVRALGAWAKSTPEGRWALEQKGVGPVLTAGLGTHIDITRAPTVGHIWRFAGLDPTVTWGKGEKRPWNAKLKVLCWKLSDSFVKVSGRPGAYYGQVYRSRKALEVERDSRLLFADQAARSLATKNIRDAGLRETYESGHLPAGRLDARARRYAVKLFLAHYHEVARKAAGLDVPLPYAIAHLQHVHKIDPPGPSVAEVMNDVA